MNWEDITRSQYYQDADDYDKEVQRNQFINQTVEQYGMNEQQAQSFRQEFDRYTAPRGNVYSGGFGDAWKSVGSGALTATADTAAFFTGGTPNAISKSIRGYGDAMAQDRSPSTIEAVENFGFGDNQEITGRGLLYGSLSGLGSTVPMMAGGGLLGAGLKAGGRAVSGYGKAKKALEATDNVADATGAAGRLAKLDKRIDTLGGGAGYGITGGAMVGGSAGNQTYQEVMALDDQTLLSSPEFQNYYRQTYQQSPDNKRQAFDTAKEQLASDLAQGASNKAGLIGAASMAVLGPKLQKIIQGKGAQGFLKNTGAGAGTEGVQETIEGGGQQLSTNSELMNIDNRGLWQNVGNVAATGALLGTVSGGMMAAPGGAWNRNKPIALTQEQLGEQITANQQTMIRAEQQRAGYNNEITRAQEALNNENENIRMIEMQRQQPGADHAFLDEQLQQVQGERDKIAATIEENGKRAEGAVRHIREMALQNARMKQQLKNNSNQPSTQPQPQPQPQPAPEWNGWNDNGVDYNRPVNKRGEQAESFRTPQTNPFNDMGEQRIGDNNGNPFKSPIEAMNYANDNQMNRFPFMVQKVNGGYILVGMPDPVQQQAEQAGKITRINPEDEQSGDWDQVLEGEYIPLSDVVQAEQRRRASQPALTHQPAQEQPAQATNELYQTAQAAYDHIQRNGLQGQPVQLDNGLWAVRPQPTGLADGRRTYVDSAGNVQEDYQQVLSRQPQVQDEQETQAAQNHPGYAYQGNDNDYRLYSEKASQLNKLMRRFQGDHRDKSLFTQLKKLIQETKRLEKSAMEQARQLRKPIATVNRIRLLQQARAALESHRIEEFNALMNDIRQTNLEEQARLSGQDSANNLNYDSRLSNAQYRQYLQMTAEEVQADEALNKARARAAKGKGGQVQSDDTLLTAIGRLGGIRTDTVEGTVGESIKFWSKNNGKGLSGRFLNKNGLTLDDMGRVLSDYGYYDANGQEYGANSLTDAITDEIAGRPRFSQAMGDYSQVAGQQQVSRAASGGSNVTGPAVQAALAGEPLSPAYRQEVSRILDEAESDPYFDKPQYLNQQAANIEQSRRDNAVTEDWYDRYETADIGYAEGKTGLDTDAFNEADWQLVESEARELSTLADAQANEQANQVEEDEADTYERTGARVRYGAGGRAQQTTGQGTEAEGSAAEQRSTDQEVTPPAFDLTTQTEQELQAQAEQQQTAEAQQRQQETQAQQKAEADREANDFVLSGSDSTSDQAAARGQADLLGAQPAPSNTDQTTAPDPTPTPAQIEAGNYKKEHIRLQGLDVSIENKAGSTRSGTDPDGNTWSVTMNNDYGYIKRTEGADGDHVDVFIGGNPDSDKVYVVDQVNRNGSFDEHKVMLGFDSLESAVAGYKGNYTKGWKVGDVTELTMDELKNWLNDGDTTKPLATQEQQAKPSELSSKVDDDTLNSEYHYKDAQEAFQHSNRSAPKAYQERFVKSVQDVYQAGLEKAETEQQKAALDTAIQQFKSDYLKAEKDYFAVRSGVASSNIAGRNNFNSRQAEKRSNADDRALEQLNNRIDAIKHGVARAVSDARTTEQKQRDNEADAAKRKKDTINKHTVSAARYIGEVANAIREGKTELAKSYRQTFMPKAFEDIQQAMEIAREETIKTLEVMNKSLQDVGGLLKVVGPRSNLGKLYRDVQAENRQASEVTNKPVTGSNSANRYKISKSDTVQTGIKSVIAGKVALEMSEQLGVTVNAVTDESQLPQHVQEQMQADGVTRIKGVFDKRTGQAYIVARNLNNEAEAIKTVLHEVAGHQALTQMLGSTMDSIMARIHNDMPAAERQRIERAYGSQLNGMDPQTRKSVVAEEWLANLAETNPKSSTLKRFVSKVRRVLRTLFKNMEWTQDDVFELLKSARNKLKDNGPKPPKGGKKSESSQNRYSIAAAAAQNTQPDEINEIINRVNAGGLQQEGIVQRAKRWLDEANLLAKDTWKAIGDKFYVGMIDQFDPLAKMEKSVNDGKLKEAKESGYKAALRTKNLDAVMTAILGKGTPELKDGSVAVRSGSKGLLEIFEPLAKDGQLELWETWAGARRAQRLLQEGKENLYTQADIDKINRHVDARPELKRQFEEAHKQYQAFNKQILDFGEQAGLIDPQSRKLWETDDYLPFHRINELDDGEQSSLLRRKGLSNQQSGIKQLEGGVGRISPMEAIYRNTRSLVDASMKNIAMQRITEVGEAAGAMEKANGRIRLTADQVKERLVQKGIIDENDNLTQEQTKQWEALLIKFEDMGEGSVKVSRNGKTEVYHVKEGNEDLLETMQAMGPDTLHGILKVFAVPKRLLTSMVTADPSFMARNFVRDTLSTWMTVHPEINGKTVQGSLLDAVKNVNRGLESDDHWALMMAGGGGGGFYEINPDNIRGKLTPGQYKAHHRRVMDNIEQGWQWWQKQGSRFENANRLAVFDDVIKKGGSIAEAAHQAQDVMNFTKRGKWQSMRILTEIIPFLNARVQGLDRLYRGAKETPAAMLTRGLIYASASIALWAMFADDDRYKELPEHEKLIWHHMWMPDGTHLRLPKPFEMGAIFATVPEVFNNVAFNGEDAEWGGKMIGKMFTDVFAMGMPQFISPALDVARNRNSFTKAPILSLGMQYQMPESQYTPWTSETTKAIAEAMPDGAPEWMRSPKRLEYLLRGYFGTLGSYALMAADALAREVRDAPERPEMSIRRVPVIGSFIRGDDGGATRFSTEMYDLLRESNSLASTIKNYTEQGRLEEAAELEGANKEALSRRKKLNRYSRNISKLKKEVRGILDSRYMSAQLKKQRIDRLNRQINDLYQEAINKTGY